MKKLNKLRYTAIFILAGILIFCTCAMTCTALAEESPKNYYVCFSSQNYAVRNANKMKQTDDGKYILENKTLSSADDFYVTDNAGTRYYGPDDKPLCVEEAAAFDYDIIFSPDSEFTESGDWTKTDCRISYRFYTPAAYSLKIGEEPIALTYNPYNTAYDMYYISCINLAANTLVRYGESENAEKHTIDTDGYYRIVFTPDKTQGGNLYKFDIDGRYGTGDEYKYNIYIEDAPQYYLSFKEEVPAGFSKEQTYFPLSRNEENVAAAEYESEAFFLGSRDYTLKYIIWELSGGTYRPIDDDNNENTDFSKLEASDPGWYTLHFIDGGDLFTSQLQWDERDFGNFYVVGDFNKYGFDASGAVDIDEKFAFRILQEDDDDYEEDYDQYLLYLTVTKNDLSDGETEFYITDGKNKYKDGTEYISLNTQGTYKIIFSEEHTYSRGRHYRYLLINEESESTEIVLSSADEFIDFAKKCSASADYSKGLTVYLQSDLDFSGKNFVSVKTFSGTFLGGFHTLKNIRVSDVDNSAAVFETVTRTGKIDRLNVDNLLLDGDDMVGFVGKNYGIIQYVNVSGKISGKNYVGGICAYNGRSVNDEDAATTDSNNVLSYALIKGCKNHADIKGETKVGGIAGYNSGEISGCLSDAAINGKKSASSSSVVNVGGIAGHSVYRIWDCQNTGNVTGGADSLYVGGICGLSSGELYFCFNRSNVSATRYTGGICGYYGTVEQDDEDLEDYFGGMDYENFLQNYFGDDESNGTDGEPDMQIHKIMYSANYGTVSAVECAGGIVGKSPSALLFVYDCASTGEIHVTAGNYAGGIIGSAQSIQIRGCMSAGYIFAQGLDVGNYAGGIAGEADDVRYCMSAATVKGENYLGGICGKANGTLIGCYSNVLLLPSDDTVQAGMIAGSAEAFNASLDSFGETVKGNYYVGEGGGIGGVDYGKEYHFAAASIASDKLASSDTLSPYLCEDFMSEYWQGGSEKTTYPTLYYFENVEDCAEFDDDATWESLFTAYKDTFSDLTQNNAQIIYTIAFLEWNKDNGELYDDGILQTDNFEKIASFRVYAGETIGCPTFFYATRSENGKYVYEGSEARYFVSFPEAVIVNRNMTVYALYQEISTSLHDDSGNIFVEGEFVKGTVVETAQFGDYTSLKFVLNGEEIIPQNVTVKVKADDAENCRVVIFDNGSEKEIFSTVSGDYLCFSYENGQYYKIIPIAHESLPDWGWLLIGASGMLVLCAITTGIVCAVRVKKKKEYH